MMQVWHKPKNTQEGRTMMTRMVSDSEMRQRFTDPEEASIRRQEEEPNEDRLLADAEDEEFAELWASDRGNQGA
jgi:hypothetical protein